MRRRRAHLALALASSLACAGAAAEPRLPASGAEVIEVLPNGGDAGQRELRLLRARLTANPTDLALATGLARRYIELGRRDADPRYLGYAQAALAPWWRSQEPPPPVRLLRATLLQSEHRFDEALRDLAGVLAREPDNAQAWLTRATIETVRADYGAATRSCARLAALGQTMAAAGCAAAVGAVTGRLAASERLLATTLAREGGADPALDAWALTGLAEMAVRSGDQQAARERFARALRLAPGDAYLLGAYADFLLDRRELDAAARLLRPHRRVDALLLRYTLALRESGAAGAELEAAKAELRARFDAAAWRGDGVHLREQARYALALQGEARAALALARRNWDSQKEVADARVLLEAALAARDPAGARPVLDWMRANRVQDPRLQDLAARLQGGA
ncbi:hypothetical protein B0920_02740 [Massilia sp. KIM]|uniref:hypothetical protein n=1 Tax=Massilia sp. KIM TaxID=1955422 RepID=UPI00098FF9C5|nr:hypothetical protein [Massilia sp. KIM]OON62401.1 hypothetical protein B0920_02740 [Massilia sp. KIM]